MAWTARLILQQRPVPSGRLGPARAGNRGQSHGLLGIPAVLGADGKPHTETVADLG